MRRRSSPIGLVAIVCAACGGTASDAAPERGSAPPADVVPQVPSTPEAPAPEPPGAIGCPMDASAPSSAPIDAAAALAAAPGGDTARGGPSCDGISPPDDVPMRAYTKMPRSPCNLWCLPGSSDEGGLLAFPYVVDGFTCHTAAVEFFTADGIPVAEPSPVGMTLQPFAQPSGYMVAATPYLGPGWTVVSTWDPGARRGTQLGYQAALTDPLASRYGPDPISHEAAAPNPLGGVALAGALRVSADASFEHSAVMFAPGPQGTALRWGPASLESGGTVLGIGVDVLGRTLVLTDGAGQFGDGHVAAQWFGAEGGALTCAFPLLARYAAPEGSGRTTRTWLEAVPLAGGGLAVRRADETPDGSNRLVVTRRYVAVVESGVARFAAAPGWMRALGGATLRLARGGRAYAVLREGGAASTCTQRLEVLAPDGTSCGAREYRIADGACTTYPLGVGADGTVFQRLPKELEPTVGSVDSYGVFSACTWRWWTGALR